MTAATEHKLCPKCGASVQVCDHLYALPDRKVEGEDNPNYYVIVPATTFQTAERVMHEVGSMFDCHIIGAYAVDQDAPLMGSA